MKKNVIFTLIILFISINLFSQSIDYGTYECTYAKTTYEIVLNFKKKDRFTLSFFAIPLDEVITKGGIRISDKQLPKFRENLEKALVKYNEWVNTAKENNVTSLAKFIDMGNPKGMAGEAFFVFGNSWHDSYVLQFSYQFIVHENNPNDISYLLYVSTLNLFAKDNRFITCQGFALVFTSSEEISNFIQLLSIDKINEAKNKPNPESLFK